MSLPIRPLSNGAVQWIVLCHPATYHNAELHTLAIVLRFTFVTKINIPPQHRDIRLSGPLTTRHFYLLWSFRSYQILRP